MAQNEKQAGSGAALPPEKPKQPAPLHEVLRKSRKLLIIDDQPNVVKVLSLTLGGMFDIPKGLGHVDSLAQAMALIDAHNPDVLISDKRFDMKDGNAHLKLLDYAKSKNPKAIVILFSAHIGVEDCGSEGSSFDQVVDKGQPERLIALMAGLC